MMLIIDLLRAISFHKWLIFFVWLPIIAVKNSESFSLFTFKKISLSDSRLVDPSSIKRHFLKMRIGPVNKENNPLFFTAIPCWTLLWIRRTIHGILILLFEIHRHFTCMHFTFDGFHYALCEFSFQSKSSF